MTFLDASVLLASEDSTDRNHRAAVDLLALGDFKTLDLTLYEVTNVADAKWRRPVAGRRLRTFVWGLEANSDLLRADGPLIERAAQIVAEHGISAYDAAYVAGAERAGLPLASCDECDLVSKGLARLPADLLEQADRDDPAQASDPADSDPQR